MPIVGSFAGASARAYGLGAGVQVGDFESIATITAGSAVANIEFTSIPATYSHLQIRFAGLTANDQLIQFNSDTGSNYKSHYIFGDGASAASSVIAPATYVYFGYSPSATYPYVANIDLLDYANTNKYKTMKVLAGGDANGSGYAFLTSGVWLSTNAITSIKLYPSSGNFSQNTKAALYGMKA
jgi:hypothetical protein